METTETSNSERVRRCEAETRDGTPCQKYPAKGAARCRFHGGASTGPTDTDALAKRMQGNDYAEGNAGGAPELNTNAQTSGAWSDWQKVYDRLDDDRRERVDQFTEDYFRRVDLENCDADPSLSEEEIMEKARQAAVLTVLQDRAMADTFDRGVAVEEEVDVDGETYTCLKPNPSWRAELDHSARQRGLLREIGVLPVRG